METVEVLAIGSQVIIDGEIPATVKRICIENEQGGISYECVWWDERKRQVEWLPAREVASKNPAKTNRISLK